MNKKMERIDLPKTDAKSTLLHARNHFEKIIFKLL